MIKDQHIIDTFKTTDQIEKVVYLDNNSNLTVWNIAWGYDIGDEFAHVTANINPEIKSSDIDYFYTNEILKIEDRKNGKPCMTERKTGYNSTYKKLAVQWINETLCFVSSSVLADSFVVRNHQLLLAAKRWL